MSFALVRPTCCFTRTDSFPGFRCVFFFNPCHCFGAEISFNPGGCFTETTVKLALQGEKRQLRRVVVRDRSKLSASVFFFPEFPSFDSFLLYTSVSVSILPFSLI